MPIKSFGNIRYELEKMTTQADPTPDIILNPAASDEVADLPLLVIVRDPRSPDWPPADAVKTEGLPTPPGDWHKINSIYFLKEDEAAQNLKARLSGRDVSPYKLQMDVWQRTKTGP